TQITEHWQNFYTEIRPVKNWKINADFAYQAINRFRSIQELTVYETLPDKSVIPSGNTVPSNIQQFHINDSYWTSNIYSSYDLSLKNDHNFKLLLGAQFEMSDTKLIDVAKTNLLFQEVPSLQTASGDAVAI